MKPIKLTLWGFLTLTSLLWLLATPFPETWSYFNFRFLANQYSGSIAIGAMSLCMLLAIRPTTLSQKLNGLDKAYRLHKWLGITALIASLTHFWFAHGTKWLVGWGLLERPQRQRMQPKTLEDFNLEQWLGGFRKTAETIGEYAFYIALILLVMALVKRIPYHWFKKLHKWLAVIYLALVFHAVVLFKFDYWQQPLGYLMIILLSAGVISALIVLTKQVGKNRKIAGKVQQVISYPESESVELWINAPQWQGHKAGQFIFLNHASFSEPYPFTLANLTNPLRILVKNLGNDTACLAEKIHVGDEVEIEGAYGAFHFDDNADKQVWIAMGVGITPFLSRLSQLEEAPNGKPVTLFYSYHTADKALLDELSYRANKANIQLILWNSQQNGRLTAEFIQKHSNITAQSSIWYCGNTAFSKSLKATFKTVLFHQELFEMR